MKFYETHMYASTQIYTPQTHKEKTAEDILYGACPDQSVYTLVQTGYKLFANIVIIRPNRPWPGCADEQADNLCLLYVADC